MQQGDREDAGMALEEPRRHGPPQKRGGNQDGVGKVRHGEETAGQNAGAPGGAERRPQTAIQHVLQQQLLQNAPDEIEGAAKHRVKGAVREITFDENRGTRNRKDDPPLSHGVAELRGTKADGVHRLAMREERDRNENQRHCNSDERRARMHQPDVRQNDSGKPKRLRQWLPTSQTYQPLRHERPPRVL